MSIPLTTREPNTRESRRADMRVPFVITSRAGAASWNVPLTSGLCLPKGRVSDDRDWAVEGWDAQTVAAQAEILDRWSDGSVRWLLVHFVAPAVSAGETHCELVSSPRAQSRKAGATSRLLPDCSGFLLKSPGQQLTFRLTLNDERGTPREFILTNIREESCGPIRQVIVADEQLHGRELIKLQLRLNIWPTAGLVEAQTRLRNTDRARHTGGLWDLGDSGSFVFRELSLSVSSTSTGAAEAIAWRATVDGKTRTAAAAREVSITQHGSGGRNWASTNHVAADGQVSVRDRGFEVVSQDGVLRGHRSEPTVTVLGGTGQLSIAVPEFWQQFPGRLSVRDESINVGLFPQIGDHLHELQGGEQKTQSFWISTHTTSDDRQHLRWVYQQPRITQSANWIRSANVFPWFPDTDRGQYADYIYDATTGRHSIEARRATTDEYGWRNFGDVPADHEQTHYDGNNTVVSHYNNQFDMVLGGILTFAVSGNADWYDLFAPLARHVMDIDVYHTHRDRAAFNGGMFWHTDHYVDAATATHRGYSRANAVDKADYGGGLSNEHNYTTGLLYYYFLTGNPEARETVVSLADWVFEMDRSSGTVWGLLDSGDTGLASRTVFDEFHGPGRGVGNSINALLDGWLLTRDVKYMDKAEQLIQRAVHPQQDCDALHLSDAEGHWSYTVCLTAIGRYLTVKREAGKLDASYAYVRDALAHYGRWMTEHERPTLSEPEKLQYVTEAWAAQDFRKANVLRIAATCCDDPVEEQAMRHRADEINDAAWKDLYAFGDKHLTARCLSILMTEGLREVFHRTCEPDYFPPAVERYPESDWKMFVPQKERVKRMLKSPRGIVLAALRAMNPVRCWRAIDAFVRHV